MQAAAGVIAGKGKLEVMSMRDDKACVRTSRGTNSREARLRSVIYRKCKADTNSSTVSKGAWIHPPVLYAIGD
ncbi:hypothetical protein PFICI_15144 [Pestalotiopsis fici W106-1]|uniref:Uncharacterized protein n=1 Tax=Pestalotiopsis fici (strain W106-1 / CGMCC3.15140) TaxID=1229662 RepID=W3WHD5_PESFW|nr:uncharacterized protein PFICI_15144 [Pestalotiopsis fici W106-1]ETS73199.1 hypothetical protein PFICI_15144 [Pestalotiopsis fici W106-1]